MTPALVAEIRNLPAIAAVPSVPPVEPAPPGQVAWLFRVAAFFEVERVAPKRFAETGARYRQLSRPAAAEEIRPVYSGAAPRAPGTDGRPRPPTGNEGP